MKKLILIISLFFIVIIAVLNVGLLYDNYSDYGISKIQSSIISTLGVVPSVLLLFFRSGIKWISVTKILALITMATHAIIEEQRVISPTLHREIYFYLNALLIPLAIISMIAIHRKLIYNI